MAGLTCDVTLGNTGKTCRKYIGINDMLIFSKTRQEIAMAATASIADTYDALIKAGTIFPQLFGTVEFTNDENVVVDNTFTGSIILYQKGGKDMFKLANPNDWDKYNTLLGQSDNATLYIWRGYSLNYLRGVYDSTRVKFRMEKVYVSKSYEKATATTPEYMVITVESAETKYANNNAFTIEPSFQINDLEGLKDLQITDASSAVDTIRVTVTDKATGGEDILDLVLADFLVKIAGVETAPTTMRLVGNVYELTNDAYVAGDVTVELQTPTVMDKLYKYYGDAITITLA